MRRMLVGVLCLVSAGLFPTDASAQQLPSPLRLETCWYGVCAGITSQFYFVETQPILAPNTGEIWNSQGFAGYYAFDPFDLSLQLTTMAFPIGIYSGSVVNGCLSGSTVQVYYGGYGDFFGTGCP